MFMIITDEVEVKMNSKHINTYIEMGYSGKVGEIIKVKVSDLPKGSHIRVSVMCDICSVVKDVKYYGYINRTMDSLYYCNKCSYEKVKANNMKKYGVENTLELECVKNSRQETLKSKYGIDNISKISQDKVRMTKYTRYGDMNYNNRELAKKTVKDRYGVDNALQNGFIFKKQQLSGFLCKRYNDNLYYRGSYELDFIKYCEANYIQVENGPSIKYKYDGMDKIYHSDFYLPEYDLICEIKSNYYYNLYIDKNNIKKEACLERGYKFIFIIDKDYSILEEIKKAL
jgi:hypothetical protein